VSGGDEEARMKIIKDTAKRCLGERSLARLDFFRHPSMQQCWGPFNGQKFRQRIFFDLLFVFPIKALVETGTFRGTTTALFAATLLPVYSVERDHRNFAYAKMRFLFNRYNVRLYHSDSRSFLRDLSDDSQFPKEDAFFYLDAHRGKDLPLRDELEIIFSQWRSPIVMIDDFQVPDSDYAFHDYGPGKVINLAYINPVVSTHNLSVFFPAVNSSEETGERQGCAVLCSEISGMEIDTKIKTLVRDASR